MDDSRPLMFLVSTTPAARDIRNGLGSPAYSYYFAVEALAPILERLGAWRLIDRPESRLPYLASQAESAGFRPVHLAVNPLQDCYFSPTLPNIVLPFWEFPEIPDRDLGDDLRQNWVRSVRGASLVVTACEFTAEAFRKAKIAAPIAVVPIPVAPESFKLPEWDAQHSWTVECRHEILGGVTPSEPARLLMADAPQPVPSRPWLVARSVFRRVSPLMRPETVDRLSGLGRTMRSMKGKSIANGTILGLRGSYRRHIRPLLSDHAVRRVTSLKEAILRAMGRSVSEPLDPLLPSTPLTVSGLVYLSIFNVGDPRKNWSDLLTAFLMAFRNRSDVTLVIKLVTSPRCEFHEMGMLRTKYQEMGIEHRCRVVVITEFLPENQMAELFQATTYYVNTSHAEGACLPLMRALAGGRPAIAPNHTAMADYVDSSVAFVPGSNPEPICWPHDPDKRLATTRYRLVWSDIRDEFVRSAEIVENDPQRYRAMAQSARDRMTTYASSDRVEASLREALKLLETRLPHKVWDRQVTS